jgi:acyl-CoA reductase-like NAD-dependent aldehyde dehydrogenase
MIATQRVPGETAVAATRIPVVNPSTGELIGEVPEQSVEEVEQVVARARAAQPAWASIPLAERCAIMRRFLRRLRDDPTLAETISAESGKPHRESEGIEVFYALELTRFYTSRRTRRAIEDEVRRPFLFPNKRARVIRHPRGVVVVIGPWNWPLLNNFADCIAPLIAGNSVILKPSEWTPFTSLLIRKHWIAAGLPDGVFQVVTGRGATGAALVDRADMVFFTGSQGVGRKIGRTCGERLVPAVLELGGKSPMIVLADADLPRAARAAVWSAFAHSGQVCIRTERVLVEKSVAEKFVALCAVEVAKLRQGPPTRGDNGGVDVGAITFPPQIDVVESQIRDAVARGARVVSGGRRRGNLRGNFFEPTVLANVTSDMAVMNEETFGPLLPIMAVDNADEALALTNASPLGLSGSVWSRDVRRARDIARRIESGSVCVNDVLVNYFSVQAPLGGIKASGVGFRHGPDGLQQFCRIETVVDDQPILGAFSEYISGTLQFPYEPRVHRLLRWLMRRIY